jgi:hypothetical protein
MVTKQICLRGLKLAVNLDKIVYDIAHDCDLDVVELTKREGFIFVEVRCTLRGELDNIKAFEHLTAIFSQSRPFII